VDRITMHPLRITIVQGAFLPVPPLLGGAVEKVWYALGQEFVRAGHRVVHVSRTHSDLPDENTEAGVLHRRVRGYDTPRALWRLKLLDLAYSLRVRRILPEADILVTNTFWLPVLERRRSRGRPYVHVARYPKGQMKLYPQRSVLQTVSEPIREAILREVPNAQARVRVVPYPLAPRYLVELEKPRKVILYTGRIHPEKGVHVLIAAFRRLTESDRAGWTLRIIGPWETSQGGGGGDYRAELQSEAEKAGGAIELMEPIFDEAVLVRHYREAALFAYPSLAERGETFGLAALEAMAAGCVPVVSGLGCFEDFIQHGTNGLVFNHRAADPAGNLCDALSGLMRSPQRQAQLRQAAWSTARNYTLPRIANEFIADFETLVPPTLALATSVHA
jgi:glycosyltransferase involved in cell wall biosynthesis